MVKKFASYNEIITIAALNFSKLTTLWLLIIILWIQIQVIIKLPQLSSPLTTFLLLRTVDFESIEWLLKAFVGKVIKVVFITARARLVATLHPLDALPTEAFSTAGHLVRLSEDMEANGTLGLKPLWRFFNKFTLKSNSTS